MKAPFWLGLGLLIALTLTGWFTWQTLQQSISFGSRPWTVLDIHDGDTLRVQRGGQVLRVRLACIDAPELRQPWGTASREHLRQLINRNRQQVFLKVSGQDRYGRAVAEVFAKGRFLQAEQVRVGLAYLYPQYLNSCPDAAVVQRAEAIAKQQRAGVWKQPNATRPWDYRRSH